MLTSLYGGIAFYSRFKLGRQRLSQLGVKLEHLNKMVKIFATAFLIDKVIRLHKLKKMNVVVRKDHKGDTAPVGEVQKKGTFDLGAEIHGGGAPGSKVSSSAAAVGRGGYVGAGRGGR